MSNNLRKPYIDMAKGIGILMVIYGHCVTVGNAFVTWQCSFFMPLFFLCSGLCYSKPKSFKQNAQKTLVPYYFWGAIGFVISLGFAVLKGTVGLDQLKDLGFFLIGMSTWNYPLWFLVAFFVCKCVFDGVMALSFEKRIGYIRVAVAAGAFVVGICLAYIRKKYVFFFPFRADIGLVMTSFMLIGFYSKQIVDRLANATVIKELIVAGALLVINLICVRCNTLVSVNSSDYGNPLVFLIGAVSGSYFIIVLCQAASRLPLLENVLAWFGRNSLTIMCAHAIVLLFVAKLLLIINRFVGLSATTLDLVKFICCTLAVIPLCFLLNIVKQVRKNAKEK